MHILFSPLQATSTLNQANLIKRLIEEKGHECTLRPTITVLDVKNQDYDAFLWFTLASWAFVGSIIAPYVLSKRPGCVYVTLEGMPAHATRLRGNIKHIDFVTVSNYVADCMQKGGLNVRGVVHHGIDTPLCNSIRKEARELKKELKDRYGDKCIFIFNSRHDPRKRLESLISVAKTLLMKGRDDFVLLLITDSTANELLVRENINRSVYMLPNFGTLSYETVLRYMAGADYLVHPSMCVLPDTMVYTYGRIKPIREVKEGDYILTHKGRFKRVYRVIKLPYHGKLIGIKPRYVNHFIWLTPDHPVLAGKRTWQWSQPNKGTKNPLNLNLNWIPASSLTKDFVTVIPKVRDDTVKIKPELYLSNTIDIDGVLKSIGRNQFGSIFVHPTVKPIPSLINPSNNFMELVGYYLSDAKVYSTVSNELALGLLLLMAKLDATSTYLDYTNIEHGYAVKTNTIYLGFKPKGRYLQYAKQDEEYVYVPVDTIESKLYSGNVFNLEVEDDNSFVAEGIAVHNCEGFGLPVLEANALGVPALHAWIPPLSEFSSKDFNFVWDWSGHIEVVEIKTQFWLFHTYPTEMLMQMFEYAIDTYYNDRKAYDEYCRKAVRHVSQWDYRKVYPQLLQYIGIE